VVVHAINLLPYLLTTLIISYFWEGVSGHAYGTNTVSVVSLSVSR
jgi:hypothetical protein